MCVFGGRGASPSTALSSVERFDPATGTWEPLPPMKVPRKCLVSAAMRVEGGRVGERAGHGQPLQVSFRRLLEPFKYLKFS